MDEIFEHLLQDTDRGISINQIVNRIVFPNHDICMQAKAALERDYGEFCFAAVIPDYEDFQHMDPTDATNAAAQKELSSILALGEPETAPAAKAEEKPAESEQGGFEEVEGDPNDLPF